MLVMVDSQPMLPVIDEQTQYRFGTDHRGTPRPIFEDFQWRYAHGGRFTLDAAAAKWNHKVDRYFDETRSAFEHSWLVPGPDDSLVPAIVWLNCPWSDITPWVELVLDKVADREADQAVLLLPNRNTAPWWGKYHRWFDRRELPYRIPFDYPPGEAEKSAPFEHCTLWTVEKALVKP